MENLIQKEKQAKLNRKVCFASCVYFIMISGIIFPVRFFVEHNLDTIISFLLCFIIILICKDKIIQWPSANNKIIFALVLYGSMVIFSGIYFGVLGYISYGFFYISIPVILLLIVYDKEQVLVLIKAACIGLSIAFLLMIIVSVLLCPLGVEQYQSFKGNPNALGSIAAIGVNTSIYLRIKLKSHFKYLFLFTEGIGIGLIVFSRSRTALLIVIVSYIVLSSYYIINKKVNKRFIINVIKFIVIIFISNVIIYTCLTSLNNSIGLKNNSDVKDSFEKYFVVDFDTNDSNVTFEQILLMSSQRNLKGIADDNSFSSGRIMIWKTFYNNLNLFPGHKYSNLEVNHIKGYNAHNGFLQIAYSFGIITGIIYIGIILYIIYRCIKVFLFSRRERRMSIETCFSLIITGGFFIESMLSADVSPFSYLYVLLLNLCVIPNVCNKLIYKKEQNV